MRGLTILGTLIIVAQVLLSLYQIRYYNAFMNKLIKRYDTCPGFDKDWVDRKSVV